MGLLAWSRKLVLICGSLCAVLATDRQVFCQPLSANYVVHISVDALRGDLLQELVSGAPSTYPNFARLQNEGASTYNARSDFFYTDTVPNHISMITGRPVAQPAGLPNTVHHGYANNFPGANHTIHQFGNRSVRYKSSTFDVAHDHGLSTALYASKTRLEILDRSYNAANGAPDTVGSDNGPAKIDVSMFVDRSSSDIVDSLVADLASTPANYTFLHLVEPDTVGHASGWGNPIWNDSVATIDARLGQILSAIESSADLNGQTAIILTGDHGGGVDVHVEASAFENYNVPLFAWGAGLPAASNLYDLATNRMDPGMSRPDYTDPSQPWRNGDTGNLAMMTLGLGTIPGSFMVPSLVPEPASAVTALGLVGLLGFLARRRSGSRAS